MAEEKEKNEETAKTAKELYGDKLPNEVLESGIGVGYVSEVRESGAPAGVAGEDDKRALPEEERKEAEEAESKDAEKEAEK